MSRHVLTRVLPQVARHLPGDVAIEGVTVTPGGLRLPVAFGLVRIAEGRTRGFYVGYRDGEAAAFYSPARWRRMVRQGVAWVVTSDVRADPRAAGPAVRREVPTGEAVR